MSPGGGHGNPLQYSCLKNCMHRGLVVCSPEGCQESATIEAIEHTGTVCCSFPSDFNRQMWLRWALCLSHSTEGNPPLSLPLLNLSQEHPLEVCVEESQVNMNSTCVWSSHEFCDITLVHTGPLSKLLRILAEFFLPTCIVFSVSFSHTLLQVCQCFLPPWRPLSFLGFQTASLAFDVSSLMSFKKVVN